MTFVVATRKLERLSHRVLILGIEVNTRGWLTRMFRVVKDTCPEMSQVADSGNAALADTLNLIDSRSQTQTKMSVNTEAISQALQFVSHKPYMPSAYVIGQENVPGVYEISLGYGAKHALLFTSTTQFETPGNFSMMATANGELPVPCNGSEE